MGVKKYFRRQKKRFGAYLKKRYAPAGRLDFGKIASDVGKLKGLINTEIKRYDHGQIFNVGIAGAGWNLWEVAALPQGSLSYERNGASVRYKSVQFRCMVRRAQTALAAQKTERVRCMLIVDKEPLVAGLGGNPLQTDLMSSTLVTSFRSINAIEEKRFRVLWDRTVKVDIEDQEKEIKIYKKLNLLTRWKNDATIGDAIINNAMYLVFFSDSDAATSTAAPLVEFVLRTSYVDN